MEIGKLSKFGLSKNDAKVYETLINLGRSKTGIIIQNAGISSSSTYICLQNLIQKGLVSYQVKNNVKYYQAELPNKLIEDSKSQTEYLEKLSQEITSLPINHLERNDVNVYQGIHGFKRAHEIMASEAKNGEEINAITYSLYFGKSKSIRQFFSNLDKRLLTQIKCKMKMIVDEDLKNVIMSDRSSFVKKYEFRCLPKEYFNPCGINISDSMVIIAVWGKSPIAFTIRNKAVIDSFRANFNFLWSKGRK